jgi:hypothetical protein
VKICARRLESACGVSKSTSGQAQFGNNSERGWHVISALSRRNKKKKPEGEREERKAHEKGSLAATTTTAAAQAVCKIEAGAGRRQLMMCFGGV